MASTSAYDEKLLSQAPEVTKADLQDGYNADLLREANVKRTTSARVAPTPPPLRSNSDHQFHQHDKDIESAAAPLQPKGNNVIYQEPRTPWWRTVKGIVIIAVVVIVIILVAVLGGVLGSRNSKPVKGLSKQPQGTSSAGGEQGSSGGPGSAPSSGSASPTSSVTTAAQPIASNSSGTPGNNNGGTSSSGTSPAGPDTGNTSSGSSGGSGRPVEGSTPVGSGNGVTSRSEGLVLEVMLRDLGVQL